MTPYERLCGKPQQSWPKAAQAERNRCDSKGNLWVFVFGSRTVPICVLCHHALIAHTLTARSAAISRFPCYFSGWPLIFFVSTIRQVIWLSPSTLGYTTTILLSIFLQMWMLECLGMYIFQQSVPRWILSMAHPTSKFAWWGGLWYDPHKQDSTCESHWAVSFHFPPRARCFFCGKPAQLAILEATRPIPWYPPGTGYAAVRNRSCCLWAWLWCLLTIISLHCLS